MSYQRTSCRRTLSESPRRGPTITFPATPFAQTHQEFERRALEPERFAVPAPLLRQRYYCDHHHVRPQCRHHHRSDLRWASRTHDRGPQNIRRAGQPGSEILGRFSCLQSPVSLNPGGSENPRGSDRLGRPADLASTGAGTGTWCDPTMSARINNRLRFARYELRIRQAIQPLCRRLVMAVNTAPSGNAPFGRLTGRWVPCW